MRRGRIYEVFKIYDDYAFRFHCTTKGLRDNKFRCWRKTREGEIEYFLPNPCVGDTYLFGKEVSKEEYDAFKP